MGAEALSGSFEARYSASKLLCGFAGSSAFAVAGWYFALQQMEGASLTVPAVLMLSSAFFTGAAAGFLRCLVDRQTQVRVDESGLSVKAHSGTAIPLRSLTGVRPDNFRLVFGLSKPDKFPTKNAWRRFLLALNGENAGSYFGNLWIWTGLLDCSQSDILNAIHDWRVPTDYEREMRELGAPARSDIVPRRL